MNRLTLAEVLTLFRRPAEDARWVSSADAAEYLALITYLVNRDAGNQAA
jgi:hypothetical protein